MILASSNKGKLSEIRAVLEPLGYTLTSQEEFNIRETPEETGQTFIENALLKARYAARMTQMPAIADDSGLVVPALMGRPGIYSARFAGENAADKENYEKLLQEMQYLSGDDRKACFYSIIVLLKAADDPVPIVAQGIWEGTIALSPKGYNGFGYDPVFYIPELGCTAAELSSDEKNQYSHRAKALRQLQRKSR